MLQLALSVAGPVPQRFDAEKLKNALRENRGGVYGYFWLLLRIFGMFVDTKGIDCTLVREIEAS